MKPGDTCIREVLAKIVCTSIVTCKQERCVRRRIGKGMRLLYQKFNIITFNVNLQPGSSGYSIHCPYCHQQENPVEAIFRKRHILTG